MELKQYARLIWRRAWLIVLLVAVTAVGSLLFSRPRPPIYQATMRVTVSQQMEPRRGDYYTYDGYYTWLASEYAADDFSQVVQSGEFAAAVSRRLAAQNITIPGGIIQGATVAEKQHRILTIDVTWGDPVQLEAIASAVISELEENNAYYFAQLGTTGAAVRVIDRPVVHEVGRSLRERLDFPIRLLLALIAGVALAFLLDYLDDSVRDRAELEKMGLEVLAEIPSPRQRWFWQKVRWP